MTQSAERGFFAWVTRLVREHRRELVATAKAEGLLAEDALDAVQEALTTFLDLPHSRRLADEHADSLRLMTALVRNHARNRRRRHDRSRPHVSEPEVLDAIPDDQQDVDSLLSEAEAHVMAFGCVQRLGEVQRRVVTLRLLQDQPGEQVAALLGTTPGNVAVLLHRAKRELRECMTD
ncbi:RNA polymerase sigma factor [Pyxidicoccus trucidator]|uniref:RNA polymerase sigma factor n=1 Tax=Pyxidicoccus trucidator TaxID=2709662 RepID=UPI0013DC6FC8|nr:sigma-70 family RNA polymerase sigma factor [Pyxidicoccus trucidator]